MLLPKSLLACICLIFISGLAKGQHPEAAAPDTGRKLTIVIDPAFPDQDALPFVDASQRDMIDLFRKTTKKVEGDRKDTAAAKSKVQIGVLPAIGYTLQTNFAAIISANAAFFTSKKRLHNQKVSSVQGSISYSVRNQVIFPLIARIYLKEEKYTLITNYRYLKYPSLTYGLGGHTNAADGYTIDYLYLKLHQAIVRKLSSNFYLGLGYDFDNLWHIREVNPPLGIKTDFQSYGFKTREKASGMSLHLIYDSRQNPINPNFGKLINVVYSPKFRFMGSDAAWQSLQLEFRKYLSLDRRNRHLLSFWSYNWLTLDGKPPYLLLPSTGWDESYSTGRGYIQGRFRGRNMLYDEMAYRIVLTNNGLLGAVVFANVESFSEQHTDRFEVIEPGAGFGLRIKLNKFSGTNLSIDYGFGKQGSRGFFVNLGEVF